MKWLIPLLLLSGCTTIEYRDRPAPDYIKAGCKVPAPEQYETMRDLLIYEAQLIAVIKECNARMERFGGGDDF